MSDELMSQQGSIESQINQFADSWRVSTQCPPTLESTLMKPCDVNPERLPWAQRACHLIQSDLFEACHQIVDPVKYYERCVHDSCGCDRGGDCECLCTAIAAYGTACSQSGVSVRWRSQEHCPMQCDNGKVYKSCGDPCEPSCRYLNQPRSQHCSIISCVEGCFCEEGFIEHEGNGCQNENSGRRSP